MSPAGINVGILTTMAQTVIVPQEEYDVLALF